MCVFTVQVIKTNSRSRTFRKKEKLSRSRSFKAVRIKRSFIRPDVKRGRIRMRRRCVAEVKSRETCSSRARRPRCDERTMRAAIRSFSGFRREAFRGFGARWHVDNRGESRATRWATSTTASVSIHGPRDRTPPCEPSSPCTYARYRIGRTNVTVRSRDPDWHLFLFPRRMFPRNGGRISA